MCLKIDSMFSQSSCSACRDYDSVLCRFLKFSGGDALATLSSMRVMSSQGKGRKFTGARGGRRKPGLREQRDVVYIYRRGSLRDLMRKQERGSSGTVVAQQAVERRKRQQDLLERHAERKTGTEECMNSCSQSGCSLHRQEK